MPQKQNGGRPPKGPRPPGEKGTPSFLTQFERDQILKAVKAGAGPIMAVESLHIDRRRYDRTSREDPEFKADVQAAGLLKEEICYAVVYQAGAGENGDPDRAKIYIDLCHRARAFQVGRQEARLRRKLDEDVARMQFGGSQQQGRPDLDGLPPDEVDLLERYNKGEEMTDAECLEAAKIHRRVLRGRLGGDAPDDRGGEVQEPV